MLELVSELELKRAGQRHQPVDQSVQLLDFRWGVSLVVEFDGEFEEAGEEVLWVPPVFLGAEMGGDDEEGLLVPVARVVELALEVDGLADAEEEGDAGTPDDKLPVKRLYSPGSNEWFIELQTVPESELDLGENVADGTPITRRAIQ